MQKSHIQTLRRHYIHEGEAEFKVSNQSWVKYFHLSARHLKQQASPLPPVQGTDLHPVCAASKSCCLKRQHSETSFLLVTHPHHNRGSCKLRLQKVSKPQWSGSLLAALCDMIFFLARTELCAQSHNATNCESLIHNSMTVMDDGKSVSNGTIGKNTKNSFPLNILNSLFRAWVATARKPF